MMALTCLAAAAISAALFVPLYGIAQIWIVLAVNVAVYLGYEGMRRLIVGPTVTAANVSAPASTPPRIPRHPAT